MNWPRESRWKKFFEAPRPPDATTRRATTSRGSASEVPRRILLPNCELTPDHCGGRSSLGSAGARLARSVGLEVHAGHGLNYDNVGPIAAIPEITELNIGHFLIGEAVFVGLEPSVRKMRKIMNDARDKA